MKILTVFAVFVIIAISFSFSKPDVTFFPGGNLTFAVNKFLSTRKILLAKFYLQFFQKSTQPVPWIYAHANGGAADLLYSQFTSLFPPDPDIAMIAVNAVHDYPTDLVIGQYFYAQFYIQSSITGEVTKGYSGWRCFRLECCSFRKFCAVFFS